MNPSKSSFLLMRCSIQVMIQIVDNNREVLLDPVGTRVVSIARFKST